MTDLDQLRVSWAALASGPGSDGHHVATLALEEHLEDEPVLLGADLSGARHLLVPTPAGEVVEDSSSNAVQIRELELGSNGRIYTDVVCRDPELVDVFDDLVLTMLREIRPGGAHPSKVCAEILAQWRQLLRPPSRDPLNIKQMAGLVAELQMAIDILRRDPGRRLDVWTGPTGARHDFRRGTDALEVKAALGGAEPSPEIHGLEQLAIPEGGSLHLAWFRLERVPEGSVSVAALVETLRRFIGGSPALYSRLEEAGWRPETAGETVAFEIRERRIFRVDEDFPRVVPGMFAPTPLSNRVRNLRYEVLLDPTEALSEEEVEQVLTRVATGGLS
jgi:Putative  PD-(D/E)XK family member, (DUF4420)